MQTIDVHQLGRAGIGIAEEMAKKAGYKQGAEDVINRVSKWLDEDTIAELQEEFLNERNQY